MVDTSTWHTGYQGTITARLSSTFLHLIKYMTYDYMACYKTATKSTMGMIKCDLAT